jgi:SWI/SNF chromatin-remodeling complex subunit SWI1
MPGQNFPQGMPHQFAQSASMPSGPTPASMQPHLNNMQSGFSPQAMAAQQQRLYQMQLQNQARQMQVGNPAMVGRPSGAMNPMGVNPQMAALRQMQHNLSQQNMPKPNSPDIFLKTLQKFMMTRNQPLDLNPYVSGRPIHLMQLYATVMKMGGSKKVSATNMWPAIAQTLQFPHQQYPNAAIEVRDIYAKNLAAYEQAIILSSHQQKQMDNSMQQNALQQRQSADTNAMQFQQSPVKPVPDYETQSPQQFTPSPQVSATMPNNMPPSATNGIATPQQPRQAKQQPHPQQPQPPQNQNNQRTPVNRQAQIPISTPDASLQPQAVPSGAPAKLSAPVTSKSESTPAQPIKHHIDETFKATILPDNHRHGPVIVDEIYQLGEEITRLKPNVPSFGELGVIDIHALTMSIKSGIHAEMRVALDTLMTLSSEAAVLSLDNCDDLVETLVDCAEEQLDLLAENAAEVSDEMLLPSYEEVIRGCHVEMASLLDVQEFGSLGYELDRAADRVLCITAIIRNFSFAESNFGILGSLPVIKMFSTIIRYLGTRNMLLRTNQNILEFMKDTATYLSNLAQTIHLPGKEEASYLLHFLLSFAPLPVPTLGMDGVTFTPYNPSIHRYTPAAIDGLAKLLARDEPNRMYFKAVFDEASCSPQNELLTRAFALAISPVPDQPRKPLAFADARKVFLMQGLLAAEILTGLADGATARTWLQSTDGFAIHLLRLCCLLSTERFPPPMHRHPQARGQPDMEAHAYVSIINRGLNILQKLAEKSKREDSVTGLPFPLGVLPKRESLLGALLTPNLDPGVVKQLIAYAGLGE